MSTRRFQARPTPIAGRALLAVPGPPEAAERKCVEELSTEYRLLHAATTQQAPWLWGNQSPALGGLVLVTQEPGAADRPGPASSFARDSYRGQDSHLRPPGYRATLD